MAVERCACGGPARLKPDQAGKAQVFRVYCACCGVATAWSEEPEEAVAAWNQGELMEAYDLAGV